MEINSGRVRLGFVDDRKKEEVIQTLVKFLKEFSGHQPDTFKYMGDVQAAVLMKSGIIEPAYGGERQNAV